MKLNIEFSELSQTFGANMATEARQFSSDMGEVTILHEGQNGATFIPAVSAEGIISWTNDRELPNPEPVNIKGAPGQDGTPGAKGDKGDKGDPGKDGNDGYTPVRGTDYFTDADIAEMVSAVIAALPVYNGEVEDA